MSSQPPHGAADNLPRAQPRGDGLVRAGFVCGLISLTAALLGGLFASGVVSDLTSGEGMLLLVGALPVALVGLLLSGAGYSSTSRRRLARAGIAFSLIVVSLFLLALLVVYLSWSACQPSCI
ncbi:MAG TPA: hypothetical protein VKT52_10495 [Ktedonobacterales bacterium]|nr:hypothetical protein [Ktedonobacterales bacterium]